MQYARPIADISVGSWSTTPLWDKLDEVAPDDATTQVQSSNRPSNDTFEVRLSSVTDPLQSVGHVVRIRMYGTSGHTWSAYLYQGTTLVKTLVSGAAVPSGYTTYSYTLTSGEADSISDYGDLRVRIVANGSASGRDYVTWVEMEVPDVLVQKTGSAVISGRGYVLVAVAKLALAAAAFGILGHVLAAGEQTFNANISGGWSGDAIYGRKNGFNALVKEVADSFNYPDNQILPSPPWVKMYSLGGDEGNLGSYYGQAVPLPNNSFRYAWSFHEQTGPTNRGIVRFAPKSLQWTTYTRLLVRAAKTGASTGRAIYVQLNTSGWCYMSVTEMVNGSYTTLLGGVNVGSAPNVVEVEQVSDTRLDIYYYFGAQKNFLGTVYTNVTQPGYAGIYLYRTNSYSAQADDLYYYELFGSPAIVSVRGAQTVQKSMGARGSATVSGKGNLFIWSEDHYGTVAVTGAGVLSISGRKDAASPIEAFDDFERADGSAGANWADIPGNGGLIIDSGAISSQTGEWRIGVWEKHDWNADQSVTVKYRSSPAVRGGAVLRGSSSQNRGYAVGLMANESYAQWAVFCSIGGGGFGWVWSSGGYPIVQIGDSVTYEITGYPPAIKCYVNGAFRWQMNPGGINLIATGKPGAYVTGFGQIDEWRGVLNAPVPVEFSGKGSLTVSVIKGGAAQTLIGTTYTDDFNRPDGPPGNGWVSHPDWYPGRIIGQRVTNAGRGSYENVFLWQDMPACADADIEWIHSIIPDTEYVRPFVAIFQGGCRGGTGPGEWMNGGYAVAFDLPAWGRWNLREYGSGGGIDYNWWNTATHGFPPHGTRIRVEKRGDTFRVYENAVLVDTLIDTRHRYFGEAGYIGFSQLNTAPSVGLDDFSATLYLPQSGILISGKGVAKIVGKKSITAYITIHGGGVIYASARENAWRATAISGRGTVTLVGKMGAKKSVSLHGGGAFALAGRAGMLGNVFNAGGGNLDATGDSSFVDTASVAVLIHGGGDLNAAGNRAAKQDTYVFGGGRVEVVYDRAWPYLEVGRIENPDAVCHLVKLEMDYCSRTFGISPCLASGTPCYNTWKTCKYITAYSPGTEVYRFVSAEYPQALPDARPYVDSVKYMPTEIKTNLTVNARVSFTMVDEPDADVDTDPYWTQRSSHPGTYWKRWLARNVNYKGRIVRIYEGVYGRAESTFVQKWMGRLENIKVKGDRFTFEAVDLLKDLAKVEIPSKTNAKLALELAANSGQSFVITEDADKFPSSGYVRIQDEIVRYTAVNVATKTFSIGGIANRGQFGTSAVVHPAKEKVQGVKYYSPKNPVEILLDMLLVDAGMKDSWVATQSVANVNNAFPSNNTYIELPEATTGSWTAPFLLRLRQNTTGAVEFVRVTVKGAYISAPTPARRWGFETYNGTMTGRGLFGTTPISGTIGEITAERGSFEQVDADAFYFYRDWPLRDIDFTSVISEPTKLSDLYMEIVDLLDSKSWVAENLKITFRKNTTNTPTTGYVSLSDSDNIVYDSGSVDVNEKSRISRMTVYWDKIVTGKYSDEMSYRRLDIAIDPDAETNYGDPEEKIVKCRWIDPYVTTEETVQQFVKNLAVRRIQRCKHAQNLITVKVAEKDAGVKTGDYVRLSTDELLEADGLPVTARMYQVVKRDRGQREVTLTLIQVTPRRMAVIGPAGLPAYPIATEVQRAYGFIADSTGRMSDGTEGYFIW